LRHPRRRVLPSLLGLAILVVTACSGDGDRRVVPASRPTNPPPPPAVLPGEVAPLTGLPEPDAARRQRVALVVKIDNAPRARPQAGLNQADVVVEEMVEGGVTRLAAIFHSADAVPVGPVRSARSTDIPILSALNRPLFAYAGANPVFLQQVRAAPLVDVGYDAAPGAYRRTRDRQAPYNLYSATPALFGRAPAAAAAPPALFAYRPVGQPADGEPVRRAQVRYEGRVVTDVVYEWNGSGFARTQNGTGHLDAAGTQVTPANVVIQFVDYHETGLVDRSNTGVPEGQLVGEGEAWVLTDGKVVRGRWSKPVPAAVTRYTTGAGAPVALTLGRTWVELAPPGTASLAAS
jgi:hypothetical protein